MVCEETKGKQFNSFRGYWYVSPLSLFFKTQHQGPAIPSTRIRAGFFRAASGAYSTSDSSMRPGSRGRDSPSHKQRSTSRGGMRKRGGDRDVGDTHIGAQGSSSSTPPLVAIGTGGGGDWNFSCTNLRLAVGLQRESVMENPRSRSRPSSLPSLQELVVRPRQTQESR